MMQRLMLLIAAGLVLMMLLVVNFKQRGHSTDKLENLSSIVPDDQWFQERVLQNPKLVLVEFTATWCGFCRQQAGILEEVQKEYGAQLEVVPVDVDHHPQVSAAYDISGIPVLMVVKNGKILELSRGMTPRDAVEKMIQPYLTSSTSGQQDSSLGQPIEPVSEPATTSL